VTAAVRHVPGLSLRPSCYRASIWGRGTQVKIRLIGLLLTLGWGVPASAAVLECLAVRSVGPNYQATEEHLAKYKPRVLIEETVAGATLSRCSFSDSTQRDSCDTYKVDRIAFDENRKIKKFYVFSSQFDVQVFASMTFVENNGRGGIAFGRCEAKAP
jgi:hypothetical protein